MQARTIRTFPRATYTGVPTVCQIGKERAFAFLSRPQGGGPIAILSVVAGDGRDLVPPIDLRDLGLGDCFGAAVFVSDFDGTIKAVVNAKADEDNGRNLVIVETGIVPEVTR